MDDSIHNSKVRYSTVLGRIFCNKVDFLCKDSCADPSTGHMFYLCRLSSVGRASHSYRLLSVYASFQGNLEVKRSLKRGNLNRLAVGNPVLIPLGMSVETLHDPPKAFRGYGEEKVQTTNITVVVATKVVVGMNAGVVCSSHTGGTT